MENEIETWTTQLRKGLAELLLLRVLDQGETYGYEIMQQLLKVEPLSLSEGTVYPLLGRLTGAGFLVVRAAPSPSGPPRRYYRLTDSGKMRLQMMEAYWKLLVESIAQMKEKL